MCTTKILQRSPHTPATAADIPTTAHPSDTPAAADEKYRPLFALSPEPALVHDRDTLAFLEVNEAAVRFYGWTHDEFRGMTLRDIHPPSEQTRLSELLTTATDETGSSRATHRTKSGRILHVEVYSYPLEFAGRPARMALIHDVTDREAAAQALAESEQKYRTVVEQIKDVFYRTDALGRWTFLNQAWTSLTGNSVVGTLGTHHLAYLHPSDRRPLDDAMQPIIGGATDSVVVELRYFHKAGGYRWAEVTILATRDAGGAFTGTMGTLRDVTERRAANEERQRLATNVRLLLDSSGEGIYGLDLRGDVTFVNNRGAELLGFEPAELVGKPMHELTHHTRTDGTPYSRRDCPMERAIITGVQCQVDDEVMWKKDGTSLQVEYTASPLRDNGRLTGAVVNFRDITERKRAELELIVARDEAQAASRAKSDFLARMSHELRTPLNSVIGFANVLLKNKRGAFAEDELSYLNRIATNGRHLLGLINDILDLSKIEAGRMTLELDTVMLDTLVRETIEELEGQTRDKPIALRAELPALIRSIETDVPRMKQVLINLIGNAIKFTDEGEVVVSIEADEDGNPIRLTVRDTGIGIPQHRLAAIFSVFEQAESSTSRRFGGTGLGLAISRSLCQLMGHHLEVESTEGKGTIMRIRLGVPLRSWRRATPMTSPTVSVRPSLAIEAAPLALVVDDDADARVLLGQILEDAGCRVMHAATGIEGLRMAREQRPAMIFLDLRLPQISGFDVLRILQQDETLKEVPVAIVSVAATESRGVLQGAAAYFDKPVSREQVTDLVRRWLPAAAARIE